MEISRLESAGFMRSMSEMIAMGGDAHADLGEATERYIERRDGLEMLGDAAHPGGFPRIKCLHAHVAHQLITGDNPVGKATLDELSWEDPSTPCV
jgi:uncharacterized protein